MSELQAYYEIFRTGYWADPDPQVCRCHGQGWVLSEVDTWHECPCHPGQPHPESDYPELEALGDTTEPVPTYRDTIPTPPPTFDDDIPF